MLRTIVSREHDVARKRAPMKIGEFRIILDRLQQLCVSAGAKGPAKDLQALRDVLGPHAEKPVDVFVAETLNSLSRPPKLKSRKNTSELSKSYPVNEDAVRHHVAQLRNAGTNRSSFDQAMDKLKSDNALRLADLTEIAHQYSSSVTKYKSIASAHQDISKAFIRQARFENKLR